MKESPTASPNSNLLVAIMGPTGSGKTDLAESLADRLGADLINADAYQAYRGFSIGTAKPQNAKRYALIDILDPEEPYGVGQFVAMACEQIRHAFSERRSVLVVGGTGLYVRALFQDYALLGPPPTPELRETLQTRLQTEGLEALIAELRSKDPGLADATDLANPRRVTRALERLQLGIVATPLDLPPRTQIKIGIDLPTENLERRIIQRLDQMFQNGWLEEIRTLVANGVKKDAPAMDAIGYRALYDVVIHNASLESARESIVTATRQFAKRQRTWLRREPELHWIEADPAETLCDRAFNYIEMCRG